MRLVDLIPIHRGVPRDMRSAILLEWDKTSIDRIRLSAWVGFSLYALLLYVDIARGQSEVELYNQLPFRILRIIHFTGFLFLPLGLATAIFHESIKRSAVNRAIIIYGFLVVMILAVFSNAVLSLHVSGSLILYVGFILMANWTLAMNTWQRIVFNAISLALILYFILSPIPDFQTFDVGEDVRVYRVLKVFEATFLTFIAFVFALFDEGYRLINFQAKHELADDKEKLERSERVKSHLFANIAHEFRAPLTVISGLTRQLIDTRNEDTPVRLEMIDRNTGRMLDLVDQVLALSKLDEGELELHLERMDIVAFMGYVEDTFRGYATSRNIDFQLEIPYVSLTYELDKELLFKVLSNLLSNAFKFTPEGGRVTLGLEVESDGLEPRLRIYVEDTGSGIHPNDLPYIFDRFYRAEATRHDDHGGTGIGLSMVKELVKMSGGDVEVESTLGKGSKFTISFAMSPSQKEPAVISNSYGPLDEVSYEGVDEHLYSSERSLSLMDKSTVLVIEDNKDVCDLITSFLWPDYHVLRANDGEQGELLARDLLPDIILSDIKMPRRDGIELCRSIKSTEVTSHIPVIFLTGVTDDGVRVKALEAGAIDVMSKPFNEDELRGKIRSVIALRDSLQSKFREDSPENEGTEESIDHRFVRKTREAIINELGNADYRVTDLCRSMGMSRTQLHNKLKALTGRSTSAFIREIRLKEACKLLRLGELNVSEVAYDVGFTDPAYFSRVFTNAYGMPPSQFAESV